jgi:hypothetical protein
MWVGLRVTEIARRRLRGAAVALTVVAGVGWSAEGQAQTQPQPPVPQYPPVTDGRFNIDLFEQPALGSPRLVGMAGAINSVAEGAAGLYTNPASPAVRPETRSDKFAWNIYFSTYAPASGQDVNNNGQPITSVRRSLLGAAGLLLQYGKWGATLDAGYTAHEIAPQAGGGLGVRSFIGHLAVARTLLEDSVAVGVAVRAGALNVYTLEGHQTLFTRGGASGEVGAVWKPKGQDFRVALGVGAPVYTGSVRSHCDPMNCYGYILPGGGVVPWDGTVGAAWRFADNAWNQAVSTDYRDERSLTVAVDLTVIGAVDTGFGMEAYANKQLQQSGRHATFTPRLGLESELIRGWLRLRAGTYQEGGRFAGIPGRPHATGGAEVRLFAFRLLGHERRLSLSLAADAASRYHNGSASLGFWN